VTVVRLWLVAMLALLGACASEYETFAPPPLDFSDRQPVSLQVERVAIDSAYLPAGPSPALPLHPEEATRALLKQRLRALGGTDRLQAVILDASVQEEALETTPGVRGFLTTEMEARLVGNLKVRVDRLDPTGAVVGSVTTAVTRSRGIPEGVGYAERQRIAYELVRDLVNDLDGGLMANLRESFGGLIRS
jgi:hypothetical protein